MTGSACIIVNPAAGRGGIQASLPRIQQAFEALGVTHLFQSTIAGEEAILAQRCIAAGARTIVAVGGDGTCSQIANAIISSGAACALAVVPTGTGNDFAKTLGVDRYSPERIAKLVVSASSTRIDVGAVDGQYFLNSCGFGFDASVLAASRQVRFLKGDAVYIYSALKQLFRYRGESVTADRIAPKTDRMLMVTVSNGKYLGGAFKIAPQASVIDGRLDVCFFADSGVIERIGLFVGAFRGTHVGMPSVTTGRTDSLRLVFDGSPAMEIDGELKVARSRVVEVKCLPRALAVVAAPGAPRNSH